MYQHILVPTDGSELAQKAAGKGLLLAQSLGASISAITISPPYEAFTISGVEVLSSRDDYDRLCETDAARFLGVIEKQAADMGVACETDYRVHEHAWEAIIEAAQRKKCDLIHMGSHGRGGIAALILGSQTRKVLTHCKLPVLVCR